jgi:hypothetical protein
MPFSISAGLTVDLQSSGLWLGRKGEPGVVSVLNSLEKRKTAGLPAICEAGRYEDTVHHG